MRAACWIFIWGQESACAERCKRIVGDTIAAASDSCGHPACPRNGSQNNHVARFAQKEVMLENSGLWEGLNFKL